MAHRAPPAAVARWGLAAPPHSSRPAVARPLPLTPRSPHRAAHPPHPTPIDPLAAALRAAMAKTTEKKASAKAESEWGAERGGVARGA